MVIRCCTLKRFVTMSFILAENRYMYQGDTFRGLQGKLKGGISFLMLTRAQRPISGVLHGFAKFTGTYPFFRSVYIGCELKDLSPGLPAWLIWPFIYLYGRFVTVGSVCSPAMVISYLIPHLRIAAILCRCSAS